MATVVGLAFIAERISTRAAGLLAGFPLGTAIALFFIGVERSPEFAAKSASYTLLGFSAAQLLAASYYLVSHYFPAIRMMAALCSIILFLLVGSLLNGFSVTLPTALAWSLASTLMFHGLLKHIPERQIDRAPKNGFSVLLFRAALSTGLLLLITAVASWSGPQWAGVLAAFPITFFPLLLIIHFKYGNGPAHTLIKHYPAGMGALISYTTSLALTYPDWGLMLGTLFSLGMAMVYLWLLSWNRRK